MEMRPAVITFTNIDRTITELSRKIYSICTTLLHRTHRIPNEKMFDDVHVLLLTHQCLLVLGKYKTAKVYKTLFLS